jgi:hypothetical protein
VKLLFVPFAIVAFVLFLLLLGAIGLVISMGVLATLGKLWRLLFGARPGGRGHESRSLPSRKD